MKLALIIAAVVLPLSVCSDVSAQNWYQDYIVDECAQYSPADPNVRGLIYRIQTGHAGFFSNCDDDLDKMNSPYIDWRCRPSRPYKPVADFLDDFHRRSRRLVNGAGNCATGNCATGNCETGKCSRGCDKAGCERNCQCNASLTDSQIALQQKSDSGSEKVIAERPIKFTKTAAKSTITKPVVNVARREASKEVSAPPQKRPVGRKTISPSQRRASLPSSVLIR